MLKHAGPAATVRVALLRERDVLTVDVLDDGPGVRRRAAEDGGHGIRGMRERARLYDGTLEAAPAPGGGFRVRLRLPVAAGDAEHPRPAGMVAP